MAPSACSFILFLQLFTTTSIARNANNSSTIFTAVFLFGDSTVDTGNNNYIITIAKADHFPYGINLQLPDYISNGRFSDGKLFPDFIASMLGMKETIPPYLNPNLSDEDLRTGVCFASSTSGFDELTVAYTGAIPVLKQLEHFKEYIEKLKKLVGDEEAKRIISGALVIISAGTNDFVFNFYDVPIRQISMNIGEYQDFVLNKLQTFVEELYRIGVRVVGVAGLPPIGCVPLQLTAKSPIQRECLEEENSDSRSYNVKLVKLLQIMQKRLKGSKIFYGDIYNPLYDMMTNPGKYGFVETKRGCCGTGIVETAPLCNKLSPLCPNSSQYLFFDSVHPSQATYKYLAKAVLKQVLPELKNFEHT